jgi:hypothetical protein
LGLTAAGAAALTGEARFAGCSVTAVGADELPDGSAVILETAAGELGAARMADTSGGNRCWFGLGVLPLPALALLAGVFGSSLLPLSSMTVSTTLTSARRPNPPPMSSGVKLRLGTMRSVLGDRA